MKFHALTLLALILLLSAYVVGHQKTIAQATQDAGLSNFQDIPLTPDDTVKIAAFRQAGLQKDRSRIPEMLEVLHTKPRRAYAYAVIHALAQIGSIESVPAIDDFTDTSILRSGNDPDLSNFAVAAKARLLAESASSDTNTPAQTVVKVSRFYKALGMTSSDLNAAIVSYHTIHTKQDESGQTKIITSTETPIHPVGVYAMRELADMVYQGSYNNFMSLPEVNSVAFQDDYASALKIRLARLPRPERLQTLIQELSHRTVGTSDRDYDIQLAINEGQAASNAAAAELQKMDGQRDIYNQRNHHSGFVSMFYIIAGVGDQSQMPLIKHFFSDPDRYVRHYAVIAYKSLSDGVKRETSIAY